MHRNKDIDRKEQILQIIPDDYRKHIKDVSIITSSERTQMVIFTLSRDQRLKFKKLVPLLEDGRSTSFYVQYNSRFYHIGGFTHVFDRVNEHNYNISPVCPMKSPKQRAFYKMIKGSCPKGTTRNAIIINTHCGLFPVHLSKLYNRLYCIDTSDAYSAEAKVNLKLNKINNCMLFSSDAARWLKDFEGHKYTPPGKKNKIGLALCDAGLLSESSCMTLLKTEPETVILFSEDKSQLERIAALVEKQPNHERTFESESEGYFIRKIKRKESLEA